MSARSLSVCIACYNEESTLEQAVDEVVEALRPHEGDHEILIVDDGSTDRSGEIADGLAERHAEVRVVHHARNAGLGGYYRTSFAEARREILYFMAADLQPVPGEYFPRFLPLFDEHDVVVGVDRREGDPLVARALSLGEKLLFAALFPGVPKIGGPLMVRRQVVDSVDLALAASDDRSWMVLWELMIRAERAGYRFATVPVRRRRRAAGSSRSSTLRTALTMTRQLLRLERVLLSRP